MFHFVSDEWNARVRSANVDGIDSIYSISMGEHSNENECQSRGTLMKSWQTEQKHFVACELRAEREINFNRIGIEVRCV